MSTIDITIRMHTAVPPTEELINTLISDLRSVANNVSTKSDFSIDYNISNVEIEYKKAEQFFDGKED